jgi:DNA-binding NarL/FixJ family response regulator
MIRLAVVDDHPAIAAAVTAAAAGPGSGVEVVGTATDVATAIDMLERAAPDVVLCDVWMSGGPGGLEIARRFGGRPRPRILMLSGFEQPSFLRAALDAGAAGYLPKSAEIGEILAAVLAAGAGQDQFAAAALRAVADAPRSPSPRELEALRLLGRGASNDEIAAGLGISIKTVESHLRRLFGRYGVLSRTELAMLAVREGWLDTDS